MNSKIAFVGMTHLGLISAVAAAEKGNQVYCFDPDVELIESLKQNKPPVSEPQLIKLMIKNKKSIFFNFDPVELRSCSVIYVAPDVSTDEEGRSDLKIINELLDIVFNNTTDLNIIIILSQVPPGFTRNKLIAKRNLYYQVETLIFGDAINRALSPERLIIGCENPKLKLPQPYLKFLEKNNCPILSMSYESAELAKISINMCLVASIATANTLAELCEEIGADWSEIIPALKLDKRIGQYSYLSPGLGISGGNLERDLTTIIKYAKNSKTDYGIVKAWLENSKRRKNWILTTIKKLKIDKIKSKRICILGLTYKENTHSIKNSPALNFINQLEGWNLIAYDPIADKNSTPYYVKRVNSIYDALNGADILIISTAWSEFKMINVNTLLENMTGKIIIDPYGILNEKSILSNGFKYFKLGMSQKYLCEN